MDSSEHEAFLKSYWNALSARGKSNIIKPVICNWDHYVIGDENSPFKGFDGRKFKITYLDGSEVHTSNLWHQGIIPEEFRSLFTNNVSSVTRE